MQLFLKFRRVVLPVVIGLTVISVVSSCGGSKKYGCPNHLFTPTILR